ncbi:hypothetical protein G0Q06_13075 [Puniceicoccales bacterium CK1056]|uniref:DUF4440 domain-containing protein n=1 Tax=Oceanipulchritudo coccoides TaxID=2706888 RepID=A0A6B2M2Z9_9BACT|nr:hypothetical protein [Oceanipulchritudo coccoides]NDV63391.1 hypothetical protein [Oceanipulchritudo coccoides]
MVIKKIWLLTFTLCLAVGSSNATNSLEEFLSRDVSVEEQERLEKIGNLHARVLALKDALDGGNGAEVEDMADENYKTALSQSESAFYVVQLGGFKVYEVQSIKVYGNTGIVIIKHLSGKDPIGKAEVSAMFWSYRKSKWYFRSFPFTPSLLPDFPDLPSCLKEGF